MKQLIFVEIFFEKYWLHILHIFRIIIFLSSAIIAGIYTTVIPIYDGDYAIFVLVRIISLISFGALFSYTVCTCIVHFVVCFSVIVTKTYQFLKELIMGVDFDEHTNH